MAEEAWRAVGRLRRLASGVAGATLVEHALILAFVVMLCVGVVATLGGDVLAWFSSVQGAF
jgi:Flp pilus assembly pilin Flp